MPKQEKIFEIFVGSPSDVDEERMILEEVTREINIHLSKTLGLRFDLVKWETHCYPDLGDDAQEVINSQIGSDYDIFLGIMWTRIGAKTDRSESGTIEEFERAYKRNLTNSNKIHILFYFKDAPISPSCIDSHQLQALGVFKKKLEGKGILYKTFKSREDFATLVRINLNRLAQDLVTELSPNKSFHTNNIIKLDKKEELEALPDNSLEEELGFFDYIELGEESLGMVTETTQKMTKLIDALGSKFRKATKYISDNRGSLSVTKIKESVADTAQAMVKFSDSLDPEIQSFKESYRIAIDSMIKAAGMAKEFGQGRQEIQKVRNDIMTLKSSIQKTYPILDELKEEVRGLPRLTSTINSAKRLAVSKLDILLQEFHIGINLTDEGLEYLDKLIANL